MLLLLIDVDVVCSELVRCCHRSDVRDQVSDSQLLLLLPLVADAKMTDKMMIRDEI